jgi:CheY-like chemotaxis protein
MARVTVVNNSPEFLDLVQDILEGDRYDTVLIDADEVDALRSIRESKPDVLMIDLRMGGAGHTGWEVAQAVRADAAFHGLPVLVCSADLQAMAEIEADLAANRNVAALRKPFEIDELTDAIDGLLSEASSS